MLYSVTYSIFLTRNFNCCSIVFCECQREKRVSTFIWRKTKWHWLNTKHETRNKKGRNGNYSWPGVMLLNDENRWLYILKFWKLWTNWKQLNNNLVVCYHIIQLLYKQSCRAHRQLLMQTNLHDSQYSLRKIKLKNVKLGSWFVVPKESKNRLKIISPHTI